MTVAISITVNDGVVMAADSATSLTNNHNQIVNVYNSANKIFNLRKGLPIGAMTWGAGAFGPASIETLAKDFRKLISSDNRFALDDPNYTLETVASEFATFLYEEHYRPNYGDIGEERPQTGLVVAGYSPGAILPERWQIDFGSGSDGPNISQLSAPGQSGITAHAQPEAVNRFVNGFSIQLPGLLQQAGVESTKVDDICNQIARSGSWFTPPAMPIQDTIDLARFLVDMTIEYVRFQPGAQSVGGPVEVAAVTKHEGFKWVQRKHYFSSKLNTSYP